MQLDKSDSAGDEVSSKPFDLLTAGLQALVREQGLDRACADASWLQNILADYSPQTPALNRVAALAAREGVARWLYASAPGAVDDVVAQAVNRLASAHGVDQGIAHDAVSAWARALGVAYAGTRSTSAPVTSASGDRVSRLIERLLSDAESLGEAGNWSVAVERYDEVLELQPGHVEATTLRAFAQRRRDKGQQSAPAAGSASGLRWRLSWMSDCGEDTFGRWASLTIAEVEHRFRFCPPGTFVMGSPDSEPGRYLNEGPQHPVTLTRGFWLGETPVTQRQWQAVAGTNPSAFSDPPMPIEQVSWIDCQAWMSRASALAGGIGLRFPTEAEWEYACRAGTTGAIYRSGNHAIALADIAWTEDNSDCEPQQVKKKAPNPWGLYDTLGNIWEWCADSERKYSTSRIVDPSGGAGAERVCRGGSWYSVSQLARAANRIVLTPGYRFFNLGFRLALDQEKK